MKNNFSDSDLGIPSNTTQWSDISDSDFGIPSNSTRSPDIASFTEYQSAIFLWKLCSPFLLLLGGFGNIATILVMRRVADDSSSSQHVFLTALAVSDFTLLYTGLLREWVRYVFHVDVRLWHLVVCKLQTWFLYSTNTSSAWLVTSVTAQRTMAVLWPHRMRMVCTVRKTWIAVAVVVLSAFLFHLHLVVGMEMFEGKRCNYRPGLYGYFFMKIFTWLDMCVSSLLPLVCLIVCDVILSVTLFQAGYSLRAGSQPNSIDDARRKTASKTTVMILALSFTFLMLTMPASVFIIWVNQVFQDLMQTEKGPALLELMIAVTYLLWYSNSAVNFLLYCMTGTRFRKAFLGWFGGCAAQPTVSDAKTCKS
ncbi:hypothetical protein ACOMHN_063249 [Nucella lapillus]